jgi:hypothetical protein
MKKQSAKKLVLKRTTLQHLRGGDSSPSVAVVCITPPVTLNKSCECTKFKTCENSCEVCILTYPSVCGDDCIVPSIGCSLQCFP